MNTRTTLEITGMLATLIGFNVLFALTFYSIYLLVS